MTFLVHGNAAEFLSFQLTSKRESYFLINGKKITNKTTIEELSKLFPLSVKSYWKEKRRKVVRLKLNKRYDEELHIEIRSNRVFSLQYWEPC